MVGAEMINSMMGKHLLPAGVLDSLQRGFQVLHSERHEHPNVTAKSIHWAWSYFHLITETTCDD